MFLLFVEPEVPVDFFTTIAEKSAGRQERKMNDAGEVALGPQENSRPGGGKIAFRDAILREQTNASGVRSNCWDTGECLESLNFLPLISFSQYPCKVPCTLIHTPSRKLLPLFSNVIYCPDDAVHMSRGRPRVFWKNALPLIFKATNGEKEGKWDEYI